MRQGFLRGPRLTEKSDASFVSGGSRSPGESSPRSMVARSTSMIWRYRGVSDLACALAISSAIREIVASSTDKASPPDVSGGFNYYIVFEVNDGPPDTRNVRC